MNEARVFRNDLLNQKKITLGIVFPAHFILLSSMSHTSLHHDPLISRSLPEQIESQPVNNS